jgi:hypothetical protein
MDEIVAFASVDDVWVCDIGALPSAAEVQGLKEKSVLDLAEDTASAVEVGLGEGYGVVVKGGDKVGKEGVGQRVTLKMIHTKDGKYGTEKFGRAVVIGIPRALMAQCPVSLLRAQVWAAIAPFFEDHPEEERERASNGYTLGIFQEYASVGEPITEKDTVNLLRKAVPTSFGSSAKEVVPQILSLHWNKHACDLFTGHMPMKTELGEALLKECIDVEEYMSIQSMSLLAACACGDLRTVKNHILRGVNLDGQSEDGETALQLAFNSGHGEMLALLLAHNVDCFAGTGYPALPVSCLCQVTTFLAERMRCAACGHPLSPRLYLTYLCLDLSRYERFESMCMSWTYDLASHHLPTFLYAIACVIVCVCPPLRRCSRDLDLSKVPSRAILFKGLLGMVLSRTFSRVRLSERGN